ncbi:lipoprotein [Micromonospora matsumotoense]|uniref:lipoprotein n=1 Tax=Micromonospora matsumotoense TaxID=121616 RepID=UPI003D8E0D31
MRRVLAIAVLVAALAGCSSDTSAPEPTPTPVAQVVTFSVEVVGGGGGFFGLSVSWGHSALANQQAKSPTWAWAHSLTLSYPDVAQVWVSAAPEARPGTESLAYVNGAPMVHCTVLINDRIVAEQTNASPSCTANLSATPPVGKSPTPARTSTGTAG